MFHIKDTELTWKQPSGPVIKIVDMTDEHILNCIIMLERHFESIIIDALKNITQLDSRAICDYYVLSYIGPSVLWPVYLDLKAEHGCRLNTARAQDLIKRLKRKQKTK